MKPKMNDDVFRDDRDDDDIYSYFSCDEDNIYENLNFSFQSWQQDETVLENDSLHNWLKMLYSDVEDYDSDDIMITKSIPGIHKNRMCSFDTEDFITQNVTNTDSVLEKFKFEIVQKCFMAIWKQESENDILNGLYLFLNDIFATYFRRNNSNNNNTANIVINNDKLSEVELLKTPSEVYDSSFKSRDKKTVQKLENFILSVTLNRILITYNASLKFYFALDSAQVFQVYGADIVKLWKLYRSTLLNNPKLLKADKRELRVFLRTLSYIFRQKKLSKAIESEVKIEQEEKIIAQVENIYQPIWQWTTDCKSVQIHDEDWEIDTEFSFFNAKNEKQNTSENMFKTICVLYCNENPDLNKIIFSYNSSSIISCNETKFDITENEKLSDPKNMIQLHDSSYGDEEHEFSSVTAWKDQIRLPFYAEDEEDLIMSENQIASLKFIQPRHVELDSKDPPPKNKEPIQSIQFISSKNIFLKFILNL